MDDTGCGVGVGGGVGGRIGAHPRASTRVRIVSRYFIMVMILNCKPYATLERVFIAFIAQIRVVVDAAKGAIGAATIDAYTIIVQRNGASLLHDAPYRQGSALPHTPSSAWSHKRHSTAAR